MADENNLTGLPENARRELKEGEVYNPVIGPEKTVPEVTMRSVFVGILMATIFSMAAAYIALKLGQGIETAIPIAILAVGISAMMARKSTLIENVNILAFGATSGIIVGGATFTLPAIYILKVDHLSSLFQLFFVAFLGGTLGVLLLIPFRRYFVSDMHGKLPFPEATATTEILVTGEKGGSQAKVLAFSMIFGFIYDSIIYTFQAWRETFTTALMGSFDYFTNNVKAVFSFNSTAAIAGLGYIIGVRYAAIIFAGSVLTWLVIIPMISYMGIWIDTPIDIGTSLPLIRDMSAGQIFVNYARYIGIGAIFMAGLIGIGKLSPVIYRSMRKGIKELIASKKDQSGDISTNIRTEKDIKMSWVLVMGIALAIVMFLYFRFSVLADQANPTTLSFIALATTLIISFLFASVSAMAIAMIGVTPISGMTLMTLILSAVVMVKAGVSGPSGMLAVILIGGIVCTALSMTGTLVTEFKIGYWLGSTPKRIQISSIIGSIIAALLVGAIIIVLNKSYGFIPGPDNPNVLPAPQANAMAAVINSLMGAANAPWRLYALGAMFAIIVEMVGVSGLAFALGMYIPIELNAPILAGAIVAHFVRKSTKSESVSKKRHDKGILIASGLIAGGALAGVFNALIMFFQGKDSKPFYQIFDMDFLETSSGANWTSIIVFVLLCGGIYYFSKRGVSEDK